MMPRQSMIILCTSKLLLKECNRLTLVWTESLVFFHLLVLVVMVMVMDGAEVASGQISRDED